MSHCIRCGSQLVQNPERPHWKHCPNCEPQWVESILTLSRLYANEAFAQFAANDPRGRPSIGGIRT